MKKILLAIFALLPVIATFAQTEPAAPAPDFQQHWLVGVKYGITQMHGDISDRDFFGKLGAESKPAFGITLSKQFTPYLSFNADFTHSGFYSRNRHIHWHDNVYFLDLSVTGKITALGVSGTLNINKLISNESGNNWNAFISAGFGYQGWNCFLQDEYNRGQYRLNTGRDTSIILARVKNAIYADSTIKEITKIGFSGKLYSSLALGAHFQITDQVGVSVEHAFRFAGSDLIDGYRNGSTDMITTTTLGVTIKLNKVFHPRERVLNYPSSQSNSVTPVKRSKKRSSAAMPELVEYTGYNALLPPPAPKIDTTGKAKPGANNAGKNIWVAEADQGQLQITGSGKVTNEVYTSPEPQVTSDMKTGLVPTYRVQIQASKTYIQVESLINKLELKEKVSVELRPDGWYRYYVGQYTVLSEARTKLAEMRAKGLKDAFIVSFRTNNRQVIK